MDNWLNENLIVFVLAGFSGFDIVKRLSARAQATCRKKVESGVKYAEAEF